MPTIDAVSSFFDQLDDVIAVFSFDNIRDAFRVGKVKCDVGKFGQQACLAQKAHLPAAGGGAGIFGIETCQR